MHRLRLPHTPPLAAHEAWHVVQQVSQLPRVALENGGQENNNTPPLAEGLVEVGQFQVIAVPVIKPLNLGTKTEIRARATRNLQVQVTDENDRPVPDVPIFFLLGNGGGASSSRAGSLAGQTSVRAVTNAQGIADMNFTASDVVGSRSQIQIRVENSNAEWQGAIQIIRAAGFWTPPNTAIVIAARTLAVGLPPILRKGTTSQVPNVEPRSGGSVILP